jgi:hypothetical protein
MKAAFGNAGSLLSPLLALLLAAAMAGLARAQTANEEYEVKAAFLFHFAQLVEWPPGALKGEGEPVRVCTLGEDPFHGELETILKGKKVGERALRVDHIKQIEEAKSCQILFVSRNEAKRMPALLAQLGSSPVLTVGESDGFVREGGIIGFSVEDQKIRFEINLDAARRAGIRVSSRLLLLAKNVTGNQG